MKPTPDSCYTCESTDQLAPTVVIIDDDSVDVLFVDRTSFYAADTFLSSDA